MTRSGAKRLTNLKELRAIAHPLRNRLLVEFFTRQVGTATSLAEAVGEPVNKVSFHLRLLAKYGFIEEAPELARDGRDRWWRLAYADGIDWDELAVSHSDAVRAQHRQGLDHTLSQIRDFFSGAYEQLPAWEQGRFSHDWYLQLTPEEAEAFNREYLQLCSEWRDRVTAKLASGEIEGRESFAIFIFGFPRQPETEHSDPAT
jgi:hypothetical protein